MHFTRLAPPSRHALSSDSGSYVSDELGVTLELDVGDDGALLSRDGSDATALREAADDLFLWTISSLGQTDDIPIRVVRDANGTAEALSLSVGRALDVRFTRAETSHTRGAETSATF